MALTRDFRETIAARAQRDSRFRETLFKEALNSYLAGDTAEGKAVLRDLVNATVGFEGLAAEIHKAEQEFAPHARSPRQSQLGKLFRNRKRASKEDPCEADSNGKNGVST